MSRKFEHVRSDEYEPLYFPNIHASICLFEAHLRRVPCGWSYPIHAESMFEIDYIVEGEKTCRVGDRTFILRCGDWILFRPGEVHENRCDCAQGLTYFCMHFDVDDPMFRKMLFTSKDMYFPSEQAETRRIRTYIQRFIQLGKKDYDNVLLKRMDVLSLSIQICSAIAAFMQKECEVPQASNRNIQLAKQAAHRLERYIGQLSDREEKTEDKDIVSSIAEDLGISPTHLNRIFRQSFGSSPRQYLSALMVRRAKLLLMDDRLSIEEVAYRLGFFDPAHFSRQFKRWTGLTPSHFR